MPNFTIIKDIFHKKRNQKIRVRAILMGTSVKKTKKGGHLETQRCK